MMRAGTAVRPDHSEAFASCSRFQLWAASITSSLATGMGCAFFLSWICAGAACRKLLSCAPTKGWMITAQQDGWKCGASRFIENAARQSERSLNRPLTLRYEIAR